MHKRLNSMTPINVKIVKDQEIPHLPWVTKDINPRISISLRKINTQKKKKVHKSKRYSKTLKIKKFQVKGHAENQEKPKDLERPSTNQLNKFKEIKYKWVQRNSVKTLIKHKFAHENYSFLFIVWVFYL